MTNATGSKVYWLALAAYWESLPKGFYYGTERGKEDCLDKARQCREYVAQAKN